MLSRLTLILGLRPRPSGLSNNRVEKPDDRLDGKPDDPLEGNPDKPFGGNPDDLF